VVELSNNEAELPHDTIKKVQKGLETLKKKAAKQKSISSDTFLNSVKNLDKNLSSLSNLFQEAAKDIKEEEEVTSGIKEKIDTLENENRKIAQGILAIADMIKELEDKIEKPRAPPMFMRGKRPVPPKIPPGLMPPKRHILTEPPVLPKRMPPGPMPPRMPGAAMPPPRPIAPKEMPTPKPMPGPPGPWGRPMAPRPPGPAPWERPAAPRPPEFPPGGPEMPMAGELPPLPTKAKKKGFFAKLFGR
jgi:hypothetical protein